MKTKDACSLRGWCMEALFFDDKSFHDNVCLTKEHHDCINLAGRTEEKAKKEIGLSECVCENCSNKECIRHPQTISLTQTNRFWEECQCKNCFIRWNQCLPVLKENEEKEFVATLTSEEKDELRNQLILLFGLPRISRCMNKLTSLAQALGIIIPKGSG